MTDAKRGCLGALLSVGAVVGTFWYLATHDGRAPWESPKQQVAQSAPSDPKKEAAFQRAIALAKAIKSSANDPSSIDIFDATYFDDGTVALQYRGRNAFGALIVNRAVWTANDKMASGSDSQVAPLWNRYVAKKNGHDLTAELRGASVLGAY